jgi:flavin-binding protein dodecin
VIVTMHFGDGSFKELEMVATDPDEAVKEAKDWVTDNAWFEVTDPSNDEVVASVTLA